MPGCVISGAAMTGRIARLIKLMELERPTGITGWMLSTFDVRLNGPIPKMVLLKRNADQVADRVL